MTKLQDAKHALVTGAASGIGRCIAFECAKRGMSLVLIDINEDGLNVVASEIKSLYDVDIFCFATDLSQPEAAKNCLAFCDDHQLEIDFLANIAGIFSFDPLTESKRTSLMLDLHVKTVTSMSIVFAERMKQRRHGYIVNMSSLSAWMPMPGIATYNASKAFIRSVSRALDFELRPWNVSVTTVCPGGCNTPLLPLPDNIRKLAVSLGFLMQPEKLAEITVKSTLKRKSEVIPGFMNHLIKGVILIMPNWAIRFIMKQVPIYRRFFPQGDA